MTDSASEAPKRPPFVEDDAHQTWLPYDKGGVPIFIAIAWSAFIVTYIVVMALVALPDLRTWLER